MKSNWIISKWAPPPPRAKIIDVVTCLQPFRRFNHFHFLVHLLPVIPRDLMVFKADIACARNADFGTQLSLPEYSYHYDKVVQLWNHYIIKLLGQIFDWMMSAILIILHDLDKGQLPRITQETAESRIDSCFLWNFQQAFLDKFLNCILWYILGHQLA